MKKLFKSTFMGIALLIATLNFSGCKNTAPWDYSFVTWYSENPAMEFNVGQYSSEPSLGYIETEGERFEVYLSWGAPTYSFEIRLSENKDLLLLGKVEYTNTCATLVVRTDNLFNNQYPTITLSRREKQIITNSWEHYIKGVNLHENNQID